LVVFAPSLGLVFPVASQGPLGILALGFLCVLWILESRIRRTNGLDLGHRLGLGLGHGKDGETLFEKGLRGPGLVDQYWVTLSVQIL
jgi:hypothetical protein